MHSIDIDRLSVMFSKYFSVLSGDQAFAFERYADLLVEWNEKINLTAITDPWGIEEKHFLDSCLPLTMIDIPENASVVDVGTGAGFPGIPWKIMRKDIDLTLLDSLNKRINFLNTFVESIGLEAETIHGRAEELGRTELRESFDIATARAVARLSVLCEYCLPFVRVGGRFVALKGGDCEEEIKSAYVAVKTLGGSIKDSISYSLPSGDKRTLVVIEKIKATPSLYPRSKGKMNNKPL